MNAQYIGTETAGVEANARLTAVTGALLFIALAIEGVTILRVHDLLKPHVFVGMVIGALVCLKLGSTGFRFARYYSGDSDYVRRGAPHPILRVIGPLVALTSVAVVVTGIVLLRAGRSTRDPWLTLHKASFIVWFVFMTVHVLAHLRETASLSAQEFTVEPTTRVPGRGARLALVAVTVAVGVASGLAALDWANAWPR
jgi:hypothetical protein